MNIEHRVCNSQIRNLNEKERSFDHVISDESVDAHGSIMKIDGWQLDRFRANPVVLFAHGSLGLPIGKSTRVWTENGKLMSRTKFAGAAQGHELAETAYQLVRDGFLGAWSVGFIPRERRLRTDLTAQEKAELPDPYVYTKQELMEYSLVPVPSNPSALMNSAHQRDFNQLMAVAERNSKAPESLIAIIARMIQQSVDRRMGQATETQACVLATEYDNHRYWLQPKDPMLMTKSEYFGLQETEPPPKHEFELIDDWGFALKLLEIGKDEVIKKKIQWMS